MTQMLLENATRLRREGKIAEAAAVYGEVLRQNPRNFDALQALGIICYQAGQVENAERLTFPDGSFDAYTIVFGIRNVSDIPAALNEAHRVLKRGGRFFCMEFSSSDWPGFAKLYDRWADKVIPRIGKAVAKDEDSYRYLVESIRRFPRPEAFKRMVADVSETYSFLNNMAEDERALTADQHKKERERYEVCRGAVSEMDPVPAERPSADATAMGI